MTATSPAAVCGSASTSTVKPSSPAVADVIGPIEAILIPARDAPPAMATKFLTVDELVKVIQCGFLASTSRARAAAYSGITVR